MITIDSKTYEIVHTFPVLHIGWEMDNEGLIVKRNNKTYLVLSNHGGYYLAKNNELEDKVKEYREAINLSSQALKLVYNKNSKGNPHD